MRLRGPWILIQSTVQVNQGRANMTEDELKERAAHTMVDTEILAILTDSMITEVLKDF